MKPLSDLLPDVLVEVARATEPIASRAIEDAVIEFYKRTGIYKADVPAIDVVASTPTYTMANPAGYQITAIHEATLDQQPLRVSSIQELDLNWDSIRRDLQEAYYQNNHGVLDSSKHWRYSEQVFPGLILAEDPNTARLVGIPTTAYAAGLAVKVTCHPTRGVTEITDWIFNTWDVAIVAGAIAQLLNMDDKPWTNTSKAQTSYASFEQMIEEAKAVRTRSYRTDENQHLRVRSWR